MGSIVGSVGSVGSLMGMDLMHPLKVDLLLSDRILVLGGGEVVPQTGLKTRTTVAIAMSAAAEVL